MIKSEYSNCNNCAKNDVCKYKEQFKALSAKIADLAMEDKDNLLNIEIACDKAGFGRTSRTPMLAQLSDRA